MTESRIVTALFVAACVISVVAAIVGDKRRKGNAYYLFGGGFLSLALGQRLGAAAFFSRRVDRSA